MDTSLLPIIIDRIQLGVFVLDRRMRILLWNHFMAVHSGRRPADVVGTNLFESFPELPKAWLTKKIDSVFLLGNFAFTSWEQRPYLFRFAHDRPVTGEIAHMRQNCTLLPLRPSFKAPVDAVCVTIADATEVSLTQDQLAAALTRLESTSRIDGLTQVANRGFWDERLQQELRRAERHDLPLSVILMDLDHFKRTNDTYGHQAGDEVLRQAAARIQETIRTSDIVARYGGEEFGILLPHTGLPEALSVAERIRMRLAAAPVKFGEHALQTTASLGVAEWRGQGDAHELVGAADRALYRAKAEGRNCCRAGE